VNRPKGCPRYIGQRTFSRHEYPGFIIEFRGWITDLMTCVRLHLSFWNHKKISCRNKSAPVYNGKHFPYPLLATRDVTKYGVCSDVTLSKLAELIRII
jgi:hypothetical protein